MKRADWVRPLLEMLEGQARRAGQAGLSSGQKALAAHLFDIIINEASCTSASYTPGHQQKYKHAVCRLHVNPHVRYAIHNSSRCSMPLYAMHMAVYLCPCAGTTGWLRVRCVSLQGRDVTPEDMKDAILQLTVTEHYYTGVQDLVTLLCEFNDITVKVCQRPHRMFSSILLMLCCMLVCRM